ncbi:MAG TPA: hypothetical protein VJ719_00405 [Chthoniobacterales bacterium]|nr:hypothetical protein [Chthoniobacterales bacterium]
MTESRRRRPWLIVATLLVTVVIGIIGARFAILSYLKSERFRQQVSAAVSRQLKAEGEFMPFQVADSTVFSDGFAAQSGGKAFFSTLKADQIRAVVNWRKLFQRSVQIDDVSIEQVAIRFPDRSPATAPQPAIAEVQPARRVSRWKVAVDKASVNRSSWRWGNNPETAGAITDSAFTMTPDGNAWLIAATGGKVSQTGWPDLSIDSAQLRYRPAALFVNEAVLRSQTGRIRVTGEVDYNKTANLQATIEDLPVAPLLTPDWRFRLKGKLGGSVRTIASFSGEPLHLDGTLRLTEGQLEALPVLEQIATFTRTERFKRVNLSKASVSFNRDGKILTAKDLLLESEGLMRVEGAFTVVDGNIDGLFQVGVTAASLQWLPGSQARVFTIAHDGYNWTTVRVTGPAAHPKEDLTARLAAAAAGEILQSTQDTILDTARGLLEQLPY